MPRSSGLENRFHVRIFDESGAELDLNNLTREEFDEFRHCHATDDLDYAYERGPVKAARVVVPHA